MNCREFRRTLASRSDSPESRAHLSGCRRCRWDWALENLRRAVLQASGWTETIAYPDESFFYALGRRIKTDRSGAERAVWLPMVRLARSYMAVAVTILVILTGLNLYLVRRPSDAIVRMDSYWHDAGGDGETLVLSDETLTHEQVLDILLTMREKDGKQP